MRLFRGFDWGGFAAMLSLIAIGTIAIWSAGNARAEAVFHGMWRTNLVTAVVGLGLYLVFALVDYRKWIGWLSLPAYALALVFLALVLLVGAEQFGGRRWLWFFQPSEVSKLTIILLVASIFGACGDKSGRGRSGFSGFLLAVVLVGVPLVLILAEPDLGTALVLVLAFLIPLVLLFILDGRRGLRECWPVALFTGVVFSVFQFLCSNVFSYELTDIVASLVAMAAAVGFLRF